MSISQRRRRQVFALFMALAMLLAACGDGGDADTASDTAAFTGDDSGGEAPLPSTAPREEGDASSADTTADMADESLDGDGLVSPTAEGEADRDVTVPAEIAALAIGRQIIFTGDVVVEAVDVATTTAAVVDAVFAAGGAIWGQDTQTSPDPRTVLTIRVPPADFDRVLDAIAGLDGATLVSQTVTTDDVTDAVIDLDARITAAESSVARVQALLDAASDLNTVFTLEEELASRQAQLETLRGQRKTLGDQVTLATITLTIVELDPDRLAPEMEVVAWLGHNEDDACPGVSDLSIGANDSAVICVGVSNTGEDTLTDIDIQSPTFRLRADDFVTLESSSGTTASLAPGEELLLTAELDADDGFIRRVDVSSGSPVDIAVTATPQTAPAAELTGDDSVIISADVDDPLPGFGESFSNGFGAMLAVVSVLLIALGVALPFLPVIAVVWWLGRRLAGSSRRQADPTMSE